MEILKTSQTTPVPSILPQINLGTILQALDASQALTALSNQTKTALDGITKQTQQAQGLLSGISTSTGQTGLLQQGNDAVSKNMTILNQFKTDVNADIQGLIDLQLVNQKSIQQTIAAESAQADKQAKVENKMTKKGNIFSLKQAQEIPVQDEFSDTTSEPISDTQDQNPDSPKFKNQGDLVNWLNTQDPINARNILFRNTTHKDQLKDALDHYYEDNAPEDQKFQIVVDLIWPLLTDSIKQEEVNNEDIFEAPYEAALTEASNTTEEIKKLANKHAEQNKGFNLKKQAQHGTVHDIVMWGPNSKRISPFNNGELESDWHVVERNKGWGFRVGDIWTIDFETVWRENIMDKYSQAYRDKDGKWIGGYINKRFEVDSNIPEMSNYQLKPGELRKPRPQSQGVYEARMENYRNEKNKVTDQWAKITSASREKTEKLATASENINFSQTKEIKPFNLKQSQTLETEDTRVEKKDFRADWSDWDYIKNLGSLSPVISNDPSKRISFLSKLGLDANRAKAISDKYESYLAANKRNKTLPHRTTREEEELFGDTHSVDPHYMTASKDSSLIKESGKLASSILEDLSKNADFDKILKKKVAYRTKSPLHKDYNPMFMLDKDVSDVKNERTCPECGSNLGGEQKNLCQTHGIVNPVHGEPYYPGQISKKKPKQNLIINPNTVVANTTYNYKESQSNIMKKKMPNLQELQEGSNPVFKDGDMYESEEIHQLDKANEHYLDSDPLTKDDNHHREHITNSFNELDED